MTGVPFLDDLSADELDAWLAATAEAPGIVDLFAGPGGWDQALAETRPDLHARTIGLEYDERACETRRAAGHHTLRVDVAAVDPATFAGRVDGLIGSPPCQAFSRAGRGAGGRAKDLLLAAVYACRDGWVAPPAAVCGEDVRADLTLEPLRWALELRPRWVALEQVREVAPLWDATAEILELHGYSTWTGVVNAANYGVPQTRERAVLIARLDGPAGPPEATHYDARRGVSLFEELEGQRPWVTMADALGVTDATKLEVDRRATYVNGDPTVRIVDGTVEPAPTLTGQAVGGGVWRVTLELVVGVPNGLPPHDPRSTGAWIFERPSTTITRTPAVARPGHRTMGLEGAGGRQFDDGSWRLSLAAAAVLQTFPRDYPWQGPKASRHLQIGNAVPPRLAAAVLAVVLD